MAEREFELTDERENLLRQIEEMLATPMVVLGFVWLALLVADLEQRTGRAARGGGSAAPRDAGPARSHAGTKTGGLT